MAKYRDHLPQLDGGLFLTDSGLETTIVFHLGRDLPEFAAFDLLRNPDEVAWLHDYFERHIAIAKDADAGFVLEATTWRANPDYVAKIGDDRWTVETANRDSIALLTDVRDRFETPETPMVISGCIGPRDDAYAPAGLMTADDAEAYHAQQIRVLADTEADFVSGFTITNVAEATGIVRAAQKAGIPSVISFTLETDGRLPVGTPLGDAIKAVDEATDGGPAYYMINCAHPTHFRETFASGGEWLKRIRGLRANASRRSHAELDESTELDVGDPVEIGSANAEFRRRYPHINILGGCCGTDHRHIAETGKACTPALAAE